MKKERKKDNNMCQVEIDFRSSRLYFERGDGDFTQAGLELSDILINVLSEKRIGRGFVDYEPNQLMRELLKPNEEFVSRNFILVNEHLPHNRPEDWNEFNCKYSIKFNNDGIIDFTARCYQLILNEDKDSDPRNREYINKYDPIDISIDTKIIDDILCRVSRDSNAPEIAKQAIKTYLNSVFMDMYKSICTEAIISSAVKAAS